MYTDLTKTWQRKFVPAQFSPESKDDVEKEFNSLLNSDVGTHKSLVKYLDHWSELMAVIEEAMSRAYVNMTIDTKNTEDEKKYMHIIEHIMPVMEDYLHKLKIKLFASPAVDMLDKDYYALFLKSAKTDTEIFKVENIPFFVEDTKLSQKYQKISGAWMVEFEGKKYTVQQMALFQEEQNRDLRERAYRAKTEVHMKDVPVLEDLYDAMLINRKKIAVGAGLSDYREYMFKAKHRFDYTPDDCLRFHDAIAEVIVPVLSEWMKVKTEKLKIGAIRPWDIYVDPDGHGVIKAFADDTELCSKVSRVFNNMDKNLGGYFDFMQKNQLLDLGSREGKAPGGYMTDLSERRVPFIFMNAVGSRRDVDTLLHEMGHSIHAFQAREQVLSVYRTSPLEFAEVASMSMELLARKYFDIIYTPEQIEIVKKDQLKKILEFFPFMSMIDSFQHWVYTNSVNGRIERGDKWQELAKRFQPFLDMSGMDDIARTRWQYPHIYTVPFYYIEYGIAQIGALQVWHNSLKIGEKHAINKYLEALQLGGSKPLPELFKTADINFAMDKKTLQELVNLIREEVGE